MTADGRVRGFLLFTRPAVGDPIALTKVFS
jgi:hypothetical protein